MAWMMREHQLLLPIICYPQGKYVSNDRKYCPSANVVFVSDTITDTKKE